VYSEIQEQNILERSERGKSKKDNATSEFAFKYKKAR